MHDVIPFYKKKILPLKKNWMKTNKEVYSSISTWRSYAHPFVQHGNNLIFKNTLKIKCMLSTDNSNYKKCKIKISK